MLALMGILFSVWGLPLGLIGFSIVTIALLWLRLKWAALVVAAIGLAYLSGGVVYRAGENACLARMQAQHTAVIAAEAVRAKEAAEVDQARDALLAKYLKQIEGANKCPITQDDADRINDAR